MGTSPSLYVWGMTCSLLTVLNAGAERRMDGCLSQSRTQQSTHRAALWKHPLLWWGSPWIEGAVSQSQGNLWGTNLQPFSLPGPHLLSRNCLGAHICRSLQKECLLFVSMEMTTDRKCTRALLDSTNSHLQSTVFQQSPPSAMHFFKWWT